MIDSGSSNRQIGGVEQKSKGGKHQKMEDMWEESSRASTERQQDDGGKWREGMISLFFFLPSLCLPYIMKILLRLNMSNQAALSFTCLFSFYLQSEMLLEVFLLESSCQGCQFVNSIRLINYVQMYLFKHVTISCNYTVVILMIYNWYHTKYHKVTVE